ncbi:MAG: hypothetical protein IJ158_12045 [Treponema sp.]|nr:hypothetical protein [Treponema sp.]
MKKILLIVCFLLVSFIVFSQASVSMQTKTYNTLKKYGLVTEGKIIDFITCLEDSSITYRIEDDGKNCVLKISFLTTPKLSNEIPTSDLVITNCIREILSGYEGNKLRTAVVLLQRKDSLVYDFALTYSYTEELFGLPLKIKMLSSIPKNATFSDKEVFEGFTSNFPDCKWKVEKF